MVLAVIALIFAAGNISAQNHIKNKRLKSTSVTRAQIGGEAIEHYVVRARKGQKMTISLSWKKEDGNWAKFSISRSSRSHRPFGRSANDDTRWTGKIPATGNYYIEVYAHPAADYTLRLKTQ
jgi:hypothetical protein